MTLYTARVWAKDTMPYDVEVRAGSSHDAQTIIARREGVKKSEVGNPHLVSEGNSTSSSDSSMSTGSAFALLVVLGYLYLLAQFFYPTVIITGLIILWKIVRIFR